MNVSLPTRDKARRHRSILDIAIMATQLSQPLKWAVLAAITGVSVFGILTIGPTPEVAAQDRSPIGKVRSVSGDFDISGGAAGPVATGLRKQLIDIQYGRTNDPHNWIRKVF